MSDSQQSKTGKVKTKSVESTGQTNSHPVQQVPAAPEWKVKYTFVGLPRMPFYPERTTKGRWPAKTMFEKALRVFWLQGEERPLEVMTDGKKVSRVVAKEDVLVSTVEILVQDGERVRLYIAADSLPQNRKKPVFEVDTKKVKPPSKGNPLTVKIVQDRKQAGPEEGKATLENGGGQMNASLWLDVSPRYPVQQVSALLEEAKRKNIQFDDSIRNAVLSAYNEKSVERADDDWVFARDEAVKNHALVANPTKERGRICVVFQQATDEGAQRHIKDVDFFRDVLPRVHPWLILATIVAAREALANATEDGGVLSGCSQPECLIEVSSTWRPFLGSLAHRTGYGLDIKAARVRGLRPLVERNPLRNELFLFERTRLLKATEDLNRQIEEHEKLIEKTNNELKGLTGQRSADPDSDARKQKQEELDAHGSRLGELESQRKAKFEENENSDREPDFCKHFVESLQALEVVGQVIGPWTVDLNTRDNMKAVVNKYEDDTQQDHINHLHITASEPLFFPL